MVGRHKLFKLVGSLICILVLAVTPLYCAPWLPLGPDGGDARRMATDPKDHTHLYMGTANGWIYESRTAGASWVRLAQVGKRDDLVLDSIVVDRENTNHLLVGAWVIDRPDGGLFISNDAGRTWLNQAEMRGQSVRALASSPSNPKAFVAGTLQGVFRTIDSGQHWKRISPAASTEIHEVQSVAVDPKDASILYAGTWHLPWKSTDAGEHWTSMKQGIIDDSDVFSIIVDPVSPQTVYASACSGIYKSEDSGDLFHKIQGIPSTARRTRVLLQSPHHLETVFAGTTEGLFRSDDSGKTWTRTTGPEIVVNDVSVDLADPRHVLIATNRGGVMASDDGGDTFHSSNGGFSARQITALKRDANHPSTLFVSVVNDKEWGGVFASENDGVNWIQRSEGLTDRDVFSLGQAPDGTMIAGTAHGIYRFDSSAGSWQRVENGPAAPTSADHKAPSVASRPLLTNTSQSLIPHPHIIPASAPQRKKASPASKTKLPQRSRPALAQRKGQQPTAKKNIKTTPQAGLAKHPTPRLSTPRPLLTKAHVPAISKVPTPAPASFDGAVYSIVTARNMVLAATSSGLLSSPDSGVTWTASAQNQGSDWRILASARNNVVAGALHSLQFSPDSGATWSPVKLPAELTQVSALAVEPSGVIWVGGREGIFVSGNAGNDWSTPHNLYGNSVTSIFYDEPTKVMTVTTAGPHGIIVTIQLPQKTASYYESGWALRFARPAGDHLVAATLFDGLVVQPRMIASPIPVTSSSLPTSDGTVRQHPSPCGTRIAP